MDKDKSRKNGFNSKEIKQRKPRKVQDLLGQNLVISSTIRTQPLILASTLEKNIGTTFEGNPKKLPSLKLTRTLKIVTFQIFLVETNLHNPSNPFLAGSMSIRDASPNTIFGVVPLETSGRPKERAFSTIANMACSHLELPGLKWFPT